jgi:hypothetical protein
MIYISFNYIHFIQFYDLRYTKKIQANAALFFFNTSAKIFLLFVEFFHQLLHISDICLPKSKKNHMNMNKKSSFKILFLFFSFLFFSFAKSNSHNNPEAVTNNDSTATAGTAVNDISEVSMLSSALYATAQLDQEGLSSKALELAVQGYKKLLEEGTVQNSRYLTIVDLSQSSRSKRFYLLDMENMKLVKHTFVAHGKNSGLDEASRFSNRPNSEASSLGFYLTKTTYNGKHGLSLKLSGLEEGFNDNAEARGIVVHGAPYVNASRVNSGYMGRSQGCPALPENEFASVINLIKDGSVLFVYNPDNNYLQHSQLLNS